MCKGQSRRERHSHFAFLLVKSKGANVDSCGSVPEMES